MSGEPFKIVEMAELNSTGLNESEFHRFLYKQRIFLSSVPKLVSAYRNTSPEDPVRVNYIRALSCQLCHVSQTVLHMELNNVCIPELS